MSRTQHSRKSTGFTIPELLVAMIIMTLLSTALLGAAVSWFGGFAIVSKREQSTADLRTALSRIRGDVNLAHLSLAENAIDDDRAPGAPANKKWAASSPDGPLILGKTPRNSSGTGIYDDAALFTGVPDSIIYYLSGTTLYRRIMPPKTGVYTANVAVPSSTTCTPVGGGCPTDEKILTDVTDYNVTYHDATNASTTALGARSIKVELQVTRSQSGKTITKKDSIQASLLELAAITPPATPGPLANPQPQLFPGVTTGPGGLQLSLSTINGDDLYIRGKLVLGVGATLNASGYRLDVADYACYNASAVPPAYQQCTAAGDYPIKTTWYTKAMGLPICADGQTADPYTSFTGWAGTCIPTAPSPNPMPIFNRAGFKSGKNPHTPTACNFPGSTNITIPGGSKTPNNTNITISPFCTLTIGGDIYIDGSLTMDSLSTLKVASGVSQRPVVVVRDKIDIRYFSKIANQSSQAPIFISLYATNATFRGNCNSSDCTNYTDAELKVNLDDGGGLSDPAIIIRPGVQANASFYAFFDKMEITYGRITGALAAPQIDISIYSQIQLIPGIWPAT